MSPPKDILITRKKIVLNKKHDEFLEVVIGEMRKIDNQIYYVISFGGHKEAFMIGAAEYEKFVDLIINLDRSPEDTWLRPRRKKRSRFD